MISRKSSMLKKHLPMFLVSFALCCVLELGIVFFSVSAAYKGLILRELYGKASQFITLLERELANLQSLTRSYAEWNDSLEYLRNAGQDFPELTYNSRWRQNNSVEFVMVINAAGERVYSTMASPGFDNADSGFFGTTNFKPGDVRVFPKDFRTLSFDSVKSFTLLAAKPYMYVSSPITDNMATVIPEGVLVFGRWLSPELLAAFLASPYTSLSFVPVSSPLPSIIPLSAVSRGPNLIFYSVVTDAEGKSIGAWKLSMDRLIPKDLHFKLISISIMILAINGLLFAITVFMLRKAAFSPISAMKEHLDRFSLSGAVQGALALGGDDELAKVASHINQLLARVSSQATELDKLGGTDGLTGLANRKRMEEYMDVEARRICRKRYESLAGEHNGRQSMLAFMVIDLDYFKRYNELYGHGHGDASLKKVAEAVCESVQRPSDLVCRFDGSCFAIVLPDTDEDGAVGLAQRIAEAVKSLCIPNAASMVAVSLTASIGVAAASIDEHFETSRIVDLAIRASVAAKKAGRNRIVPASLMGKLSQDA